MSVSSFLIRLTKVLAGSTVVVGDAMIDVIGELTGCGKAAGVVFVIDASLALLKILLIVDERESIEGLTLELCLPVEVGE